MPNQFEPHDIWFKEFLRNQLLQGMQGEMSDEDSHDFSRMTACHQRCLEPDANAKETKNAHTTPGESTLADRLRQSRHPAHARAGYPTERKRSRSAFGTE